ncbi:DUF3973 domain-containing protein [Alicyclobacillus dauci]|uniref:DUF3973 domain-containing protein n=1 Tax=Alicyclobacillus dauci TaxID=1475485 RepID=UPI003899380F
MCDSAYPQEHGNHCIKFLSEPSIDYPTYHSIYCTKCNCLRERGTSKWVFKTGYKYIDHVRYSLGICGDHNIRGWKH